MRRLLGSAAVFLSACFGEFSPPLETGASTGSLGTTGLAALSSGELVSTGQPVVCEHLDILLITDVSLSMAPFADGILDVLLALGGSIEETLQGVGSYNMALGYNAPPMVNEQAHDVPAGGEQCTQLGALVRGVDDCVDAFDGRPYLTDEDDLGAGLTCLAGGLIGGKVNPAYETPRTLDATVAFLESEEDPVLSVCNADFHHSPDPLLIILIVDDEDESEASVTQAVTSAIATQGTTLESVGLFLIGADASTCPKNEPNECGANPSCRVQEFIDRGFTNVGLGDNVRRFNICRSQEDAPADVAEDLLTQITAVVENLCVTG